MAAMPAWKIRLLTAPWPVAFLVGAMGWAAIQFVAHVLADEPLPIEETVYGVVLAGASLAIAVVYQRWHDPFDADRVDVERSLRRGEPPADAGLDPKVWTAVSDRRAQIAYNTRMLPWLVGSLAVLVVVVAFLNQDWWALVLVPCLAAVAVWRRRSDRRSLERLDQLEAALRHRTAA
jgi:hypothetical protein